MLRLLSIVVESSTKSAESGLAVAKSVQVLEARINEARDASRAAEATATALKALTASREVQLDKYIELSNRGLTPAFAEAIKNPQTLLIIVALIAAVFGLRLTLPITTSVTLPAAHQEAPHVQGDP